MKSSRACRILPALVVSAVFACLGIAAARGIAIKPLSQCRMDTWGAREGLPGYDITSLAQSRDGYLWVGTTAGLFRFDGQTFTRFDKSNTLNLHSDVIRSILATADGTLWVGTEWSGYGRLIGNRFDRRPLADDGWNSTSALDQAPDGSLWVSYFSMHPEQLVHDPVNGSVLSRHKVGGMFVTGFGNLPDHVTVFTALYDRLYQIRRAKIRPYPLAKPLPCTDLRCMATDSQGNIWIGTDYNGVFQISGKRWRQIKKVNGLSDDAVNCIYVDSDQRILVGTTNGLDCISPSGIDHIGRSDGLGSYNVRAILQDHEGNIWAAAGSTLSRFSVTALTPVKISVGKQDDYRMVTPMPNGNLVCSTRLGIYLQPSNPSRRASCLAIRGYEGTVAAENGDLIGVGPVHGGGAGFHVDEIHRGHATTVMRTPFAIINVIGYHPITVIGHSGECAVQGRPGVSHLLSRFGDPGIFDVERSADGVIWLGTEAGVIRLVNGVATLVDAGVPAGAHVLSVDVHNLGCVYLGTDHGLIRYQNGVATRYTSGDGLPDDDLLQVRADDVGHVWLGGYFGIACVSVDDLVAYNRHAVGKIRARLFTSADGVESYPTLGAPARTPNGIIWFLGADGLTAVDPRRLNTNPLAPPVLVTDAMVDGQALAVGAANRVRPGRGSFYVHFAALSFSAPEKVRFRYRLLGYDPNWHDETSARSATYTNLPPGHYRFQVRACNNDGVWTDHLAQVEFTLQPHFYVTLWFRLLCLIGIIGATLLAFRLRTAQLVRHSQVLERKVSERTKELTEANDQLVDAHAVLATQNDQLHSMQSELEAQNDELQSVQAELVAQNHELTNTQAVLAQANHQLEALATTDGLTGLMNHRTFQDRLEVEVKRHKREGMPLSLILIDVDRFKRYNDSFGHPAGDEVLRKVADILRVTARNTDIVARYGGEEFVVIAPSTDADGTILLAERLRAAIQEGDWTKRAITASFGTTTASLCSSDLDASSLQAATLISHADTALYAAKRAGRNCVRQSSLQQYSSELDTAA